MSRFYVVNESTEDTLGVADDLEKAIRLAKEVSGCGPAGDLVSVIDGEGLAVRQYASTSDGNVAERAIAVIASGVAPAHRQTVHATLNPSHLEFAVVRSGVRLGGAAGVLPSE